MNSFQIVNNPNSSIQHWLILPNDKWNSICAIMNCSQLSKVIMAAVNKTWIQNQVYYVQFEYLFRIKSLGLGGSKIQSSDVSSHEGHCYAQSAVSLIS